MKLYCSAICKNKFSECRNLLNAISDQSWSLLNCILKISFSILMSHFTSSDKFLKWNCVVSTVAYRKLAEIKKTLWYWWHVAPYCIHSGCHNLLQFVTTELLFVCLSVRLCGRSAQQLLKSLLKLNVVRNDKKKQERTAEEKQNHSKHSPFPHELLRGHTHTCWARRHHPILLRHQ